MCGVTIGLLANNLTFTRGTSAMAANDMKSAEKTYSSFIASLKWAVPLLAIITLLVIMLIAE